MKQRRNKAISPFRYAATTCVARAIALCLLVALPLNVSAAAQDGLLPLKSLTISGAPDASESEMLAVRAFNRRIAELTGAPLPVIWGAAPARGPLLLAGTRGSQPAAFSEFSDSLETAGPDAAAQAYVIALAPGTERRLYALGGGASSSARDSLGLSYALGELLRRIDLREGEWVLPLPSAPLVRKAATPNRTLYLNTGADRPKGVSLQYFSPAELHGYVDFLLEARYSRISFWQAHPSYLYPGSAESRRAGNERVHQVMREIFTYARRRGLEIFHQITPAYYDVSLHGENGESFRGVGWYTKKAGHGGVCWSKPEARAMARAVAQHEMDYFAPVDGYVTWFYDPAGCFCEECRPNQAEVLFDQFQLIAELAEDASPGAELQAVLWPTWIFPQYEEDGIPFNAEERDAFVTAFLQHLKDSYPAQSITIVDSSEGPNTNIHNELVDPAHFERNGFIYSLLGYPGESGYIFMPFRYHEQERVLRTAQGYGVQEVTLYDHYAPVTYPVVYGFAHLLYDAEATAETTLRAWAATVAKGASHAPFVETLTALEAMDKATTYASREEHLSGAEAAWKEAGASEHCLVDREWMGGYLRAQRHYIALAKSDSPESFTAAYEGFVKDLSTVPLYHDFMVQSLTPASVANLQLGPYWRGPCNDVESNGIPNH